MPGFLRSLFKKERGGHVHSKKRRSTAPQSPVQLAPVTSRRSLTQARRQRHLPRTLPAELILYIFTMAAEDPQSGRAALQTLARLSSAVLPWARSRLYSSPVLYSARGANLFVRTVRRDRTLAAKVQQLSLEGWERPADAERDADWSSTLTPPGLDRPRKTVSGRLSQILEVCRNITRLEISGAVIFSLTDFSSGENLQHLVLRSTLLSDRTTTSRYHPFFTILPSLTHLTLVNTQFDAPTAAHFLCPTTLPRVTSLHLDGLTLVDEPATMRYHGTYESILIAPHINTLYIGQRVRLPASTAQHPSRSSASFAAHCTSLSTISLPLSAAADQSVIDALPNTTLHHLVIRPSAVNDPVLATRAANVLASTCLALATLTTSLSQPGTPGPGMSHSASPSSSPSSWLTRSASYSPDSIAHSLSSILKPTPTLFELRTLALPRDWANGSGELSWSLGRVERLLGQRGVTPTYSDGLDSDKGELVSLLDGLDSGTFHEVLRHEL